MPASRKPDQAAPRPASPTGVTNGQSSDPDPRAQSGEYLTTAQGLRMPDTDHSLKAGARGPAPLEDFHLREKITHFDHERIPERVVHARGAAAHGVFESYGNAASVTKAAFLGKKGNANSRYWPTSTPTCASRWPPVLGYPPRKASRPRMSPSRPRWCRFWPSQAGSTDAESASSLTRALTLPAYLS